MIPSHYAPDPWPVDGPTELDDDEYAAALSRNQSPYLFDLDAKLRALSSERVAIWMLFLGMSYVSDTKAGRDETMQGYYIRAVIRDRAALLREIGQMAPGGRFAFLRRGTQVFYREAAKQLALSIRMIPLGPEETRQKIVGWGFAGL